MELSACLLIRDNSEFAWVVMFDTADFTCDINWWLRVLGGWTGKERTSDVHLFDSITKKWIDVETSGFPVGAGLSSHTSSLLSNSEILVVGREGSLRMQRRSGNAFILSGQFDRYRAPHVKMYVIIGCIIIDSRGQLLSMNISWNWSSKLNRR